jgi:hypothetical protein
MTSPSFPDSHHLCANFPNYKGPGPQIQMSRKITAATKWPGHSVTHNIVSSNHSEKKIFGQISKPNGCKLAKSFNWNEFQIWSITYDYTLSIQTNKFIALPIFSRFTSFMR